VAQKKEKAKQERKKKANKARRKKLKEKYADNSTIK
jgi:hypothetical protein